MISVGAIVFGLVAIAIAICVGLVVVLKTLDWIQRRAEVKRVQR